MKRTKVLRHQRAGNYFIQMRMGLEKVNCGFEIPYEIVVMKYGRVIDRIQFTDGGYWSPDEEFDQVVAHYWDKE